jgi:hypothetical protein
VASDVAPIPVSLISHFVCLFVSYVSVSHEYPHVFNGNSALVLLRET